MSTNAQRLGSVIVGVVLLAVGVVLLLVVAQHLPDALRWLGWPFVVAGIANLALVPRYSREEAPHNDEFVPLDAGRPVLGTPQVQHLATVIDRELGDLPRRVTTAPNAVRIYYDSGNFRRPGSRKTLRFRWRTTLFSGRDPNGFYRVDLDRTRRGNKRSVRVGSAVGGSFQATIGADGVQVTTLNRSVFSHAIKRALAESGTRTVMPTLTIVGIVNAVFGLVIAVGATVAALSI